MLSSLMPIPVTLPNYSVCAVKWASRPDSVNKSEQKRPGDNHLLMLAGFHARMFALLFYFVILNQLASE